MTSNLKLVIIQTRYNIPEEFREQLMKIIKSTTNEETEKDCIRNTSELSLKDLEENFRKNPLFNPGPNNYKLQ